MNPKELGEQPAMPQERLWNSKDNKDWPGIGLTKREDFAKAAMIGLLAHDCSHFSPADLLEEGVAVRALKMADALLAELCKEHP